MRTVIPVQEKDLVHPLHLWEMCSYGSGNTLAETNKAIMNTKSMCFLFVLFYAVRGDMCRVPVDVQSQSGELRFRMDWPPVENFTRILPPEWDMDMGGVPFQGHGIVWFTLGWGGSGTSFPATNAPDVSLAIRISLYDGFDFEQGVCPNCKTRVYLFDDSEWKIVTPNVTEFLHGNSAELGLALSRQMVPAHIATISRSKIAAYVECENETENLFELIVQDDVWLGHVTPEVTPTFAEQMMVPHVKTIASGTWHVCLLTVAQSMWCLGENQYYQLGQGHSNDIRGPAHVALENVQNVYAGYRSSCAVLQDESLWCWGRNEYGELGVGDREPRMLPARVDAFRGSTVTKFVNGRETSCAILNGSSLWCWGSNRNCELGLGYASERENPFVLPVQIPFFKHEIVIDVSLKSGAVCVISTNTTVWCWGTNHGGQLGLGYESGPQCHPTNVFSSAVSVVRRSGGTCVLTTNGTVWCWGGECWSTHFAYRNRA